MPTADTFDCKPMGAFVRSYLRGVSVDPFARNKRWATYTNDLNPETAAEHHMDATDFLKMLADQGVQADVILIDPPYSPRQVKECYDGIGLKMKQWDALRGWFHKRLKEQICRVLGPEGTVLTFGWNSTGMGRKLGFEIVELLLVCHGSDHNDTICVAERRAAVQQLDLAA
jgi:23S rRNA G2069 N7-methylase RlmK/C1962 C5-methylase RlmI